MGLEGIIGEEMKKVMIVSDIHAPFQDNKAVNIASMYAAVYKPDIYVIGGDLSDFYSISRFDKSPERRDNFQSELTKSQQVLDKLLENVPTKAKKVFIEGNHEYRLQQLVWNNPALYGVEDFELKNLLKLDKRGVQLLRAEGDYWKGTKPYRVGDTTILHGDNRLDGASLSAKSGYSASNTMNKLNTNLVMGHSHRGGVVYKRTPDKTLVGVESGCLCRANGNADWNQGFVTFEVDDSGKGYNYRFHNIQKGRLVEDGNIYRG
jgi:predicted phosphodiesterase